MPRPVRRKWRAPDPMLALEFKLPDGGIERKRYRCRKCGIPTMEVTVGARKGVINTDGSIHRSSCIFPARKFSIDRLGR